VRRLVQIASVTGDERRARWAAYGRVDPNSASADFLEKDYSTRAADPVGPVGSVALGDGLALRAENRQTDELISG